MSDLSAESAKRTAKLDKPYGISDDTAALTHRYQQIGISAVAAAVRYQGVAKNPAYAPALMHWQERDPEGAA